MKQQRNILLLAIISGMQVYWYGVPIPLQNALVSINHPTDFGWSNLGNWASLHDKLQKDEFIMAQLVTFTCTNARIMWFM